MIKAVVFDLDNTLVDFMAMKRLSIDAAINAMKDAGLKLSKSEIENKIDLIYSEKGIEFQNVFDELLFNEFKKIDFKILSAGVIAYRRAREAALIPYPHVHLTLIKLIKMGLKLAVVTDAPSREAWLRLSYLNLSQIFDCVVTFEDTGKRKPDSAPFKKALKMLKVKGFEAIMLGDWAERDMIGAAKVGMKTCFARYGDTFGTIHSHADFEIDDIHDLVKIIEKENNL